MKAFLVPLLKQVAIEGLINNRAPLPHTSKLGLGLAALSGLFLVAALIFVMISGYGWLLLQYDQPLAALIMAGSIVTIAAIISLIAYLLLKKKRQQKPAIQTEDIMAIFAEAGDLVGDEFAQTIKDNPKTAVLIASVVGLVAGKRFN